MCRLSSGCCFGVAQMFVPTSREILCLEGKITLPLRAFTNSINASFSMNLKGSYPTVKRPNMARWILVSSCFHVYTCPSPLGSLVNANFCCLGSSSSLGFLLFGFTGQPQKCLFMEAVPFRLPSAASNLKQYLHSAYFLSIPSSSFIHSIPK